MNKFRNWAFILGLAWMGIGGLAKAEEEEKYSPTVFSTLPKSEFSFSKKKWNWKEFQIEIFQAARKEHPQGEVRPMFGRSVLLVAKDGKEISHQYFSDFEPLGGSWGLFVPKVQPFKDRLLVVKEGDYDECFLIIDSRGIIEVIPGGEYLVTENRKLLYFESYDMEIGGAINVLDLETGKVLFSSNADFGLIWKWYKIGNLYCFTVYADVGIKSREDRSKIHFIDLALKKIIIQIVEEKFFEKAKEVSWNFAITDKASYDTPSEKVK